SLWDCSFKACQSTLSSRLADLSTALSSLFSIVIRLLLHCFYWSARPSGRRLTLSFHYSQQASQRPHTALKLLRRRSHQGAIPQRTVEQRQQHGSHFRRIYISGQLATPLGTLHQADG